MQRNQRPSAAKGISRTTQACQRCRNLKTRCLPSSQSGRCQRCFTSGNECVWVDAPRRARKLRAPSRIAQVEQKIDGLVAKLVCTSENDVTSDAAPGPSIVPPKTKLATVAPGNWMPMPSFEHRVSQPESYTEKFIEDAEVDRQYLEDIRKVHRRDEQQGARQIFGSLHRPHRRIEEPINDDLVKTLLSSGEAELLMKEFRQMAITFPFVIIPQHLSSAELHTEKPMLFLAMITVASWKDYSQQRQLDKIYRTELAHRTIISPQKTLGLVQSILVYLSWYHFVFSHKTQQIFFLHHLVVGLALDIGLYHDYQPLNSTPLRPKPAPPSAKELREKQRTFLGCYYLASMVGAAFQKPNLLKHTRFMSEAAENLRQAREYESDEAISHLIALRQIEEHIQEALFATDTAQHSMSDGRTLMHLRSIEAQLDAWKARSCHGASQRLLELSLSFSTMMLYGVALRPSKPIGPASSALAQLDSVFSALEAGKRFLEILLSFPAEEYHVISFSEWMRLPSVILTIARLCIPADEHVACGWDVQAAQEQVCLDLRLESLSHRMQALSTYDEVKQSHTDFWRGMGYIISVTKDWYIRKTQPQAPTQKTSEPVSEKATKAAMGEVSCPIPAMSPTCSPHRTESQCNTSANLALACEASVQLDNDADRNNDPFALMRSADFDFEPFLDMAGGIWGDDSYNCYSDMAFGGYTPL